MRNLIGVIRRTLDLLGPDRRWRWLLLVVLALLVAGFEALGAVFILALLELVADPTGTLHLPLAGNIGNQFPDMQRETLLLLVATSVAIFFLIRGLVLVGQAYIQARLVHNASAQLSAYLLRGYLEMPYAFHTQRNSANLVRNTFDTVSSLTSQVMIPLTKILAESLLVMGLAVVLLLTSPTATLLAVAILLPLVGILTRIVHPRLQRIGRTAQEAKEGSLKAVQQALGGVRDIKILRREAFFTKIFAEQRRSLARTHYLYAAIGQLPRALIETSLVLIIVVLFTLAVIAGDNIEGLLSTLGIFAYVGLRLQPSLRDIVKGLNDIKYGDAILDDLAEDRHLVDAAIERASRHREASPLGREFTKEIRLQRVSLAYGSGVEFALRDVSVTIGRGEFVGICGPTGGGKSTLVDLIAGLLDPSDGRVLVDGYDLADGAGWWQDQLGLVSQSVFLIDDTIRNNIALGYDAEDIDERRVQSAVRRAQLDSVIAELPQGLDSVVGERGIRLSGGQRQRVAIARAFYREPPVLIFDEGTSALDAVTESALVRGIGELRSGRTLIAVAHRLSTVRDADRILVIKAGRIEADGTYEDLMHGSELFRTLAR